MVRCAVCKFSRKPRCDTNCVFAELFPTEDDVNFKNIATRYGLRNIKKQILGVPAHERSDLINSIVFEANCWSTNRVNGVFAYLTRLEKRIARLEAAQNRFPWAPFHQEVPGQFEIPNQPSPSPNPNNVQQHYNPPYNQVLYQTQVPCYQLQPNPQPPQGSSPNPHYVQQGQNSFPYNGVSNQPQSPNYQLQLNLQPPRGPYPNPNYVHQGNHPFPDHQVSNHSQIPYYQSEPNPPNGQPQGLNQWVNDLEVNNLDQLFNQPTLTDKQPQGLNQWANVSEAELPDANGPGVNIANEPEADDPNVVIADAPVANDPEADELRAKKIFPLGDTGIPLYWYNGFSSCPGASTCQNTDTCPVALATGQKPDPPTIV